MDALTLALAARVPAAARGDRDAFAAIVDDTRSVVSSIALAIVRDVELSRDVAQDVFLAAWRDLAQLRDPNSLLPWLRQLTRHRAYHVLRTERRRLKRIDDRDLDALLDAAVDPRPDAGDRMLANEERRLLAAVLDELPDDARDVVTLYYREGQSTSHVAALLGLTEATVRQRLSRARARMRTDLLDRYGRAASRSAPNAAFTAAVLGALTIAAPGVSSAATLAAAASGASWVAKLAAVGGGAALGALGGIAGVLFGTRRLKRDARSSEERAALQRFEFTSVLLVVAAAAMFPIAWQLTLHPFSQVAVFAGFILGLAVLHGFWLPRIVRPRHLLEAREDPGRAARARAMERRAAILGWTAGLTSGGAGLLAGLLL
jgi:RNA polymerase sigma factor (sigma-70 family)